MKDKTYHIVTVECLYRGTMIRDKMWAKSWEQAIYRFCEKHGIPHDIDVPGLSGIDPLTRKRRFVKPIDTPVNNEAK